MAYEVNGQTAETTDTGYLVNLNDWNKEIAQLIADEEGIGQLTDRHWDVIEYLRDEYINNNGNQPMERAITKAMEEKWGVKLKSKDMYDLFPRAPSKQGLKVAGLPATNRKGGY
ncbi:TusE/DsrC/DsvC family sulfur relay protein [Candidatus Thiothrix sp. Deng01]|uniref:Sulfurtransferase n=1 Tax=Candidatus Thiothrix phosphatis TaxID=3112415 RepID=A0ABU6D2S1_9GAMM|nr:TusE/DsrC/DsvC family sulfur relay protein [Candidatus Thiothrix sp. Deng01]MEB4593352.1 TusE/DsrC/DsvC family sulfur relay protein [Candidatus Thiothrix sp. Deng01]